MKDFGTTIPEGNEIVFEMSLSAIPFHMSCSSFLRTCDQILIISETFAESDLLSIIKLGFGSFAGYLNFALMAGVATKVDNSFHSLCH